MEQEENILPPIRRFSFEKYMLCMGILGQLLFFCQAHKIFTLHSAQDVSLPGFVISFLSVASWVVYGLQIKNKVLVISNAVACIGAFLVIVGICIYR